MGLPLVVGVDGSDSSLQAVDRAVDEAARLGLSLRLFHASLWERYEVRRLSFSTDRPAEEVLAEHIAASCAERAQLRDPRKVMVDVGDSTEGSAAVRFAFREAEARGSALQAVRAWRRPAHEHVDHPLVADDAAGAHEERASALLTDALRDAVRDHPQVDVHRQAVEGPAHKALRDASAEADLVVVGALRRHGHFGLQLGRVAHALLHHAECPVAVVAQRA
ncbi:universal stress protein [Streptomyces afghaniensis]|uniref:universal stress protein n=1 Tax=Streptomyces afghaniensis TaxID=66865 RepID=UPI0027D8AB05|nr:universal stress protein [Streptomyces afghaniensis]